ncbi:ExbD/TolR family protein, partial [Solemya velum gill symbiont]
IVTVILSPEGVIFVNDQPVHEHELQKFLKAALDETENRIVRIRGDNEASLGSAVKVLDAAEASGAKAVDILTEKP